MVNKETLKVQRDGLDNAPIESSFASTNSNISVFPSLKYYTEKEHLETKKDFLVEERSKVHEKWASKKRWEEEALKGFLALEEEVASNPPKPSPAPTKWPKLRTDPYVDSDIDSASETTSISRATSCNDRMEKVQSATSESSFSNLSSESMTKPIEELRDKHTRLSPSWNPNRANSQRAFMLNKMPVSKLPQPTQVRSPVSNESGLPIKSPSSSPIYSNRGLELRLKHSNENIKEKYNTMDFERLQRDHARNVKILQTEKDMFEKYKVEELTKLEKLRQEMELNNQREKRTLDKHRLVTSTTASKKERQEIELLHERVKELNEKLKKKEIKSNAESARLKDRIITLSRRNEEFQQIINDLNTKLIGQNTKPKPDATPRELERTIELLTKQNLLLTKKLDQITVDSNSASCKSVTVAGNTEGSTSAPTANPTQIKVNEESNSAEFENKELDKLSSELGLVDELKEVHYADGKCERIYGNGTRLISYRNGTTKEHRPNGYIKLRFVNGDSKESFEDGKIVYYYAETKTVHSSLPDKTEIFQFANGQLEKHHVDGTIEVRFPDATIQYIYPNNEEKSIFSDGTIQTVDIHGRKVIQFVDGTKKVYEVDAVPHSTSKSTSPLERTPRKGLRTYTM
ncbi:hypothetical protein K7432_003051 [Basidiobolus ranarum]|uniref:Centromere protein J C-terminal domain-containing protein n=1 Tax=Basidiobolus ranarum TaxID=34480 RepID=A0ABR2W6V9_9FUNG